MSMAVFLLILASSLDGKNNVEKENEITRKGKFQQVTFLFLFYVYNLRISVRPSRKGKITRSTRASVATKSLKWHIPCVWRS